MYHLKNKRVRQIGENQNQSLRVKMSKKIFETKPPKKVPNSCSELFLAGSCCLLTHSRHTTLEFSSQLVTFWSHFCHESNQDTQIHVGPPTGVILVGGWIRPSHDVIISPRKKGWNVSKMVETYLWWFWCWSFQNGGFTKWSGWICVDSPDGIISVFWNQHRSGLQPTTKRWGSVPSIHLFEGSTNPKSPVKFPSKQCTMKQRKSIKITENHHIFSASK